VPDDPAIQSLHQVAQPYADLETSIAFYRDVLGLRLIARFDPPGLAFFDLRTTRLMLEQDARSAVLYLRVPDIDDAYESLRGRGVTFDGPPHLIYRDEAGQFGDAGEEEWMAFFRDPHDNILALVERRRP
jgi:methylmalonyl-CoA/ethylmalonyl-CoA epimerase